KGEAALLLWLDQKDDLLAGRTPRSKDGLSVLEMCTKFLLAKKKVLDSGEIVLRTFHDYKDICKRITNYFGPKRLVDDLRPDDFAAFRAAEAKAGGHVHVANMVQRSRTVFKFAYEAGLILHPMRFGPTFRKPNKKAMRLAKARKPKKMFEAADIVKLL